MTDSPAVPWHVVEGDPSDGLLVGRVHPGDWTNPSPAGIYDLVVLGAGTAGLVTAVGAAGLGARVAIVERSLMGGDCLNVGCVPSKALIAASRAAASARGSSRFGVGVAGVTVDFAAAMQRMRRLRADLAANDSAARLRALGIDVFLGDAAFTGAREVTVSGAHLAFSRAVIATGARAAVPDVPGLAQARVLTNETVFALTELPKRLVVIGGGPIGCELAQAFARLGSAVTILGREARLLPRDHLRAAAIVGERFRREGLTLELGATLTRIEPGARGDRVVFSSGDEEQHADADAILVAVGRTPNVKGMGLEAAGVAHDANGVTVDDHLVTTNPRVLAAGDVCSKWKFTHAADAMARIVIQNAFFPVKRKVSSLVIPWCTYTDPEVAHVGIDAEEAARHGDEVVTLEVDQRDVDRAVLDGDDEGFLAIHADRRKGTIFGATLVSAHAGETLGEVVLAMTHGLGLSAIESTIHGYPTQGEILRKAASAWRRTKLKAWMVPVLKRWIAWRR